MSCVVPLEHRVNFVNRDELKLTGKMAECVLNPVAK
jgi:hypothetical protein